MRFWNENKKYHFFVAKTRYYNIFVAKTRIYDIFVAKIYDSALIDSFLGSAGFLDSPTSYATVWPFLYMSFYSCTLCILA